MQLLKRVICVVVLCLVSLSPCLGSRIWQSGFESGEVTSNVTEWGGLQALTHFSLDHGFVNSGAYSGRFDGPGFIQSKTGNVIDTSYSRFYFCYSSLPTARNTIFQARGAGDRPIFGLYLLPNGCIECFNDQLGFRMGLTSPLPPMGWHLVEMLHEIAGGYVELRIDGMTVVTSFGNSWQSLSVDALQYGPRNPVYPPGCTEWFDDCAWNVFLGSHTTDPQNQWCGTGHIINLSPLADVGPQQWTPVGAVMHFDCVNDLPGTPDVLTYLHVQPGAAGLTDAWSLGPYPSSSVVNAVLVGVRGWGSVHSGTASITMLDSMGHTRLGSSIAWNSVQAKTVYPILVTEQTWDNLVLPLTKPYLDTSIIEGVVTDSMGGPINWTTVWASVDYR